MLTFCRKYHRYLGVILSFFIFFFALSGIVLNHREAFSGIDVSRRLLPDEYAYENWNRSAVAGTESIGGDSVLIYGNIGVWLTDKKASEFKDFNAGFLPGVDNRRIHKLLCSIKGDLLATTQAGLYQYNFHQNKWEHLFVNSVQEQLVDLAQKGDTIYVLGRSHLYETLDLCHFTSYVLPAPIDFDNKVSLFHTFRLVHSGAVFGLIGRLFIDLVALVFIFLSLTGLVFFFKPFSFLKKKRKRKTSIDKKKSRWLLRYHSKIGWISLLFLVLVSITGMFLRPPMILAIAENKVSKIPFTVLDSPNPWKDNLRRVLYDKENECFVFSTSEGMYHINDQLSSSISAYKVQPPMSIMGTKVFQQVSDSTFLHGSSLGLTLWNTKDKLSWDLISKEAYKSPERDGSPIGEHMITAYSDDFEQGELFFDYFTGAHVLNSEARFPHMPEAIAQQPMPLWNVAQEFHTGRMYRFILGNLYILIVPLSGLLIFFLLITGVVRFLRYYRKI